MKFQNLRGGRIVLKDIKVIKEKIVLLNTYLFQSKLRNCTSKSSGIFFIHNNHMQPEHTYNTKTAIKFLNIVFEVELVTMSVISFCHLNPTSWIYLDNDECIILPF